MSKIDPAIGKEIAALINTVVTMHGALQDKNNSTRANVVFMMAEDEARAKLVAMGIPVLQFNPDGSVKK